MADQNDERLNTEDAGQADENGTPETIDLSLTVGELMAAHPKLSEAMAEFGLEGLDPASTVPDVLKGLDVDPSLVVTALQSMGYEVTGFTPEANPYASQVGAVLDALFNGDDEARVSTTSVDPMMANIEAAVRRAEKEGVLPTASKPEDEN